MTVAVCSEQRHPLQDIIILPLKYIIFRIFRYSQNQAFRQKESYLVQRVKVDTKRDIGILVLKVPIVLIWGCPRLLKWTPAVIKCNLHGQIYALCSNWCTDWNITADFKMAQRVEREGSYLNLALEIQMRMQSCIHLGYTSLCFPTSSWYDALSGHPFLPAG